jgi:hypothetical protein
MLKWWHSVVGYPEGPIAWLRKVGRRQGVPGQLLEELGVGSCWFPAGFWEFWIGWNGFWRS